jgi:diamine N-acetyltransferase
MFTYQGISIRAIEENDLSRMASLRNNPQVWNCLGTVVFLNEHSQKKWFERIQSASDKAYYILFDQKHDFLGYVRFDEIDHVNKSIRVGGDILPEFQGKGLGKKMFDLILKYSFDYLNMHRVWLLVLDFNERAKNLYTKCGFQIDGRYREAIFRDGGYHDYIVMSILINEYKGRRGAKDEKHTSL